MAKDYYRADGNDDLLRRLPATEDEYDKLQAYAEQDVKATLAMYESMKPTWQKPHKAPGWLRALVLLLAVFSGFAFIGFIFWAVENHAWIAVFAVAMLLWVGVFAGRWWKP